MDFGAYLMQLRKKAQLTQRELAQKCGLTDAYVTRLEKQSSDSPSRRLCKKLARALDTEESELWKHAFTERLKRWLKKEGYKGISDKGVLDFFEQLEGKKPREQ